MNLQNAHWNKERPEEENGNTHFWRWNASVLLTKLQTSKQINYLAGQVRKIQTYMFINPVGELCSGEWREEEANAKTQVYKASDTGGESISRLEEVCSK